MGNIKKRSEALGNFLRHHNGSLHPIFHYQSEDEITLLDLTIANSALAGLNLRNTRRFDEIINGMLAKKNAKFGTGGYLEKRVIYSRSEVFQAIENRSVHLGIDIWAPAFTPLFAPLDGVVHSFKDNQAFGDYGPTIILQHEMNGISFYTLYGHLSRKSLTALKKGMLIKGGEAFSEIGPFPENGDWPPHLHFQIIMDMEGREGDFPGVSAPSEIGKYRTLCPDPNLILNLQILNQNK